MSDTERYIVIGSLINAAIFYAITAVVFLVARKTQLNKALAVQKGLWLMLIVFVALPAYVGFLPLMPTLVRLGCWVALSSVTWWVLYEVYRANWHDGWRSFLWHLWCETKRLPDRALGNRPDAC